ncbi:MAG: Rieske (2Fe-2S) protein [Allomuricauda sp.]
MRHFGGYILLFFLLACSSDSTNRNPFLQEVNFRFEINLNLPLYNKLNNIGNPIYVPNTGVGTRGVFVMRSGLSGSQYVAWEASCPNHAPNNCSTMTIDGQNAVCPCEDYTYSLFTGQQLDRPDDGNRYYDLLFYRATQSGNIVTIFN